MLLVMDVGNTNTVLGVYRDDRLQHHWRLASLRDRTVDEIRMQEIAAAGGGRRLALGEGLPERRPQPGLPLAPWLLLAACIRLVFDRLWSKPLGLRADV